MDQVTELAARQAADELRSLLVALGFWEVVVRVNKFTEPRRIVFEAEGAPELVTEICRRLTTDPADGAQT